MVSGTKEQTDPIRQLPVGALAARCQQETTEYFGHRAHDPRFCFELFRRAALEDDQRAWEILYRQYHALVHGWVVRHPAYASLGDEPAYYVNRAMEKLWNAIRGERFAKFTGLASILGYLKTCVGTTLIDQTRKQRYEQVALESPEASSAAAELGPEPEQIVQARDERRQLWQYVHSCARGQAEATVIYESFVLALKPNEIFERNTALFASVEDVYRVKQNLMNRFRRDRKLRRWSGLDD